MRDKLIIFIMTFNILLFSGCSISGKNEQVKPFKYSALHNAVRLNQVENVEELLKQDSSNINQKDNFGDTPLIDAVRYDNTSIVKTLLCNGADQNISDTYNLTPLDNAIKNNNQQIVSMLTDSNLTFCKKQINNTDIKPFEKKVPSSSLKKQHDDITIVQNVVIDPNYLSLQNTSNIKTTLGKSSLDKIELSDEELEQYINDTKTLGNL